jgi:hypothetical protein
MYAFQVYLQILVPKQFYLTQENSTTTLMQLLAKMPNFSLAVWPGPGGQQKAKDKKEDGFVTKMIGKRCDD